MARKIYAAVVFLLMIHGLRCSDGFASDNDDGGTEDDDGIGSQLTTECEIASGDFLTEGETLCVCCTRSEGILNVDLLVSLAGEDPRIDFVNRSSVIPAGRNCTSIGTVDDNVYERHKTYTVVVRIVSNSLTIPGDNNTVILQDDEDLNVECSQTFVKTQNIYEILQMQRSCSVPNLDVYGMDHCTVDCTQWNAELVFKLLDAPENVIIFPTINQEIQDDSAEHSTCREVVKGFLEAAFASSYGTSSTRSSDPVDSDDEGTSQSCYTDCTATLSTSDSCELSVFLLEQVDARKISSLNPDNVNIPTECGVYNITCCMQSLPAECTEVGSSQASGGGGGGEGEGVSIPLVGGVVGGVVGLTGLIVIVLVIGVLVMVCSRRKKREQKQRKQSPSTRVQSIVYKPKRMESTGASSDSTAASGAPLVKGGGARGVVTPGQNPNYEEVVYAESYSEWKETFAKVTIDAQYIEYGDVIGEGEFSKVYEATYSVTPNSSVPVAIKKLKTFTEKDEIDKFIAESGLMVNFDHPNILRLVGVCFNMEDNLPAIVLPYMANGDLRSFLRAKRAEMITSSDENERYPPGLSEAVLLGMCMDVARGMHYLSKCKFVHRDLAARNCMVDENMKVKVADFGLSRDIHVSDYYRLKHRQKMPVKWMAPESLFKKIYTEKTDVWSFGIVCWEIFKLGKKPYAGIDNPDLPGYISHGFRPKKPSRCPDDVFELMREIWSAEPEDRPNFRAIVISLAGMMHYQGDIESELKMETKNCRKEHPYQSVQIPAAQQYTKADNSHIYSVLEEPIYNNYSREQSLAPPEEYEVPLKSIQDPGVLGGSSSPSPSAAHYEIPGSRGHTRSPSPPHYEVPELGASSSSSPPVAPGMSSNSPPVNYEQASGIGASSSNSPPIHYESPGREINSSPQHYEMPELVASASCSQNSSYEMQNSASFLANGSVSSVPIDYEVPHSTPERDTTPRKSRTMDKRAQRKPEAPPRRSPARQNDTKLASSSPVGIPRREPEALPRKSPARQINIPTRRTEPEASQRRSPARQINMKVATSSPIAVPMSDPETLQRRSPGRHSNMKIPVQIPRSDPEAFHSRRQQSNPPSPPRIPRAAGSSNEPHAMMMFFDKKQPSSLSSSFSKADHYGLMNFEPKPPPTSTGHPEGYLKLNYPAVPNSISAPNSQEDHDMPPAGYSMLEWNRGKVVSNGSGTNSNTLPSKFSMKSHVYHTLEPAKSKNVH